jgi:molybdate transport system substrate-binding protein
MVKKVAARTTVLTHIHHRETPLLLREDRADAGPVWFSEALYQSRMRPVLGMVRIPASQNVRTVYDAAAFVSFMRSPQARAIFRSYGFGPPR